MSISLADRLKKIGQYDTRLMLLARFAWLVPAAVVLQLLSRPIPFVYHSNRAMSLGYHMIALLQDGLGSYTYLTYQESFSGLHLHALLSVPIFALGFAEASRVISFLAAVSATIILGAIATEIWGRKAGLLTPVLLWINPYFTRFAYYAWPDSLSIALTSGAIYAALKDDGNLKWYVAVLVCIFLGVTNHEWEIVVVLPVTVIYVLKSEWFRIQELLIKIDLSKSQIRKATGPALIGAGALFVVRIVGDLQPSRSHSQYFLLNNGLETLVSRDWWFHPIATGRTELFMIAHNWMLYLSVLFAIFWADRYWRERKPEQLIMLSWILSGLAIPVLLAGGYLVHLYYLWGTVAPVTVSVAYLLSRLTREITDVVSYEQSRRIFAMSVLLLACLSGAMIQVHEADATPANPDIGVMYSAEESLSAAQEVRAIAPSSQEEVAFVGDWTHGNGVALMDVHRILFYSRVKLRGEEVWGLYPGENSTYARQNTGPTFARNQSQVEQCEVMIRQVEDGIAVEPCRTQGSTGS